MRFQFAIIANYSNILFGTSFFSINLDLKLTYENILLKHFLLEKNSFIKVRRTVKLFASQLEFVSLPIDINFHQINIIFMTWNYA